MAVIANRRSVMTLFSEPTDPWSHRTRLVLAEKGINIDFIDVDKGNLPEDLSTLNPYNSVPTLVDRDLVLYDSRVIIEYLDELPKTGTGKLDRQALKSKVSDECATLL